MRKISAIAVNTMREVLRNKVLYTVLLFAALLVVVAALFGSVTVGDRSRVIKDFGLFALSFFGALMTVISGVSLLQKELKQKTIYNILSRPVSRWEFLLGKQLGLALTASILVALMGLALGLFVAAFEGRFDLQLIQAIFFVILEVVLLAGVTIFFSTVVITTALTGIFSFATYLAGRSVPSLQYLQREFQESNPALVKAAAVLDRILPDLSLLSVGDRLISGEVLGPEYAAHAVLYVAAYSAVLFLFSVLIFSRRELN